MDEVHGGRANEHYWTANNPIRPLYHVHHTATHLLRVVLLKALLALLLPASPRPQANPAAPLLSQSAAAVAAAATAACSEAAASSCAAAATNAAAASSGVVGSSGAAAAPPAELPPSAAAVGAPPAWGRAWLPVPGAVLALAAAASAQHSFGCPWPHLPHLHQPKSCAACSSRTLRAGLATGTLPPAYNSRGKGSQSWQWRQGGGRVAAGWRQGGGRVAAGWRQGGGRVAAGWRRAAGRNASPNRASASIHAKWWEAIRNNTRKARNGSMHGLSATIGPQNHRTCEIGADPGGSRS